MDVVWTRHARERFFERSLKYGVAYEEVELNVKRQKVRVVQENQTIKTIFKLLDYYFTVIKEETKKYINIVSIWEAKDNEVELWKKRK